MYRSLARRTSAARAILLVNTASLHSSRPAAQVAPSKFVAKRGERDGNGAHTRNHNQTIVLREDRKCRFNLELFLTIGDYSIVTKFQ